MAEVSIQENDFDPAAEADRLVGVGHSAGAVVSFVGLCRDEGGRLAALEIEHYPGMAEAEIGRLAADAEARWPLQALRIVHRFGRIMPGERIVLVVAVSAHRAAAFAAVDFVMDVLKTSAPFWKREHRIDGGHGDWVAAKDTDDEAAVRWA